MHKLFFSSSIFKYFNTEKETQDIVHLHILHIYFVKHIFEDLNI
jgi:hypothetical protein